MDRCWSALVGPWAIEVVQHTAQLTERGPIETTVDRFSKPLLPEPADLGVRAWTTLRALRELASYGIASYSRSPTAAEFLLFRQAPLVPAASLDWLTDGELQAHASTLEQVNARRAGAGLPAAPLPAWLTDRLDRARLAPERRTLTAAKPAALRLDRATPPPAEPQDLSL